MSDRLRRNPSAPTTDEPEPEEGYGMSAPSLKLQPLAKLGPSQREIVVFPQFDLRKGESIALRFESGEVLHLVKGYEDTYRGILPRSRLEDPFVVVRTPGHIPEVGFHGQMLPPRTAALVDEPMWVFPVAWADCLPRGTYPTRQGLHQDIVIKRSERVPEPRVVRVHLPEAYLRDSDRRFPVIYVLDGQNAFDASTSFGGVEWCLDQIAEQIEAEGGPACIIVGIDNGCERRMHEYSFCPAPRPPPPPKRKTAPAPKQAAAADAPATDAPAAAGASTQDGSGSLSVSAANTSPERASLEEESENGAVLRRAAADEDEAPLSEDEGVRDEQDSAVSDDGGGALEHLEFILYEVAPLLRSRFRIQVGQRYLVGSSMGGLFGLWTAIAHPSAFRGIACLSPSVWWSRGAVLRIPPGDGPRPKVWIDMGTRESKAMVQQFYAACRRLRALGWREGEDLHTLLVKGGAHHESSWADRSASILRFMLREHT